MLMWSGAHLSRPLDNLKSAHDQHEGGGKDPSNKISVTERYCDITNESSMKTYQMT